MSIQQETIHVPTHNIHFIRPGLLCGIYDLSYKWKLFVISSRRCTAVLCTYQACLDEYITLLDSHVFQMCKFSWFVIHWVLN